MLILGLNAFHADASAALVRDGRLVAAAEEERFRRVKHWAGFPVQAIACCLKAAGATVADIDHVAINQDNRANLPAKLRYLLLQRPDLSLILQRMRNRRSRAGIAELLRRSCPGPSFRGRLHRIEHHRAHLSSAFHVSPFDEALVLSVDGFGDFSSAAWGTGRQSRIDIGGTVRFPNSLGIFYQALTQYLGFLQYGDEYKVMGLAAYGSPSRLSAMRQIVRLANDGTFALNLEYFRHHRSCVTDEWDGCAPRFGALFSAALEQLLGPRREPDDPITEAHRDIASATQAMYEEAFLHLIETKQRQTGLTDLALAGGCAMNSVANGKIRRRTAVRRLYVQAAAGDAGGAIGAAYSVWHGLGGVRSFVMNRADWGPEFDGGAIAALLALHHGRLGEAQCRIARPCDEASLCERVAQALADGQVVGWFQGRMEWGPRALGHRSILCDPRRADAKDLLNRRIKRRESFRPFAPSVLAEAVTEWFEDDGDVPFMSQVLPIRSGKRAAVPAVTHVDGSGRLQTVSRHANPRYHRLIEAFARITGVPMVLNTSFNENEPIVCDPAEALDCFLRTNMDMLVLGDTIIERPRGA